MGRRMMHLLACAAARRFSATMAATWRQSHDRRAARVAISRRPRRRESACGWFVGSVVLRRPRLLLCPLAPAPAWIVSCQYGASTCAGPQLAIGYFLAPVFCRCVVFVPWFAAVASEAFSL